MEFLQYDEMDVEETSNLVCEMCNEGQRLYKCPRCSLFTCSLKCCNDHKVKLSCNGIRDRASFVSCRSFTENNLKSDYHFLEDVLQTKERAKRTLAHSGGGHEKKTINNKRSKQSSKKPTTAEEIPLILNDTYQRLDTYSKGVKNLFNAAKERGTKLILMPNGMTKRTLNKSCYSPKDNIITWKVYVVFILSHNYQQESLFRVDLDSSKAHQKLSFAQEALVGVSMEGVSENKTLLDIFEYFMKPTVENASHRHALRSLRLNQKNVRCLMHRIPSPTSNPVFLESAMESTLKDTLAGQTLIEYPTLYFGSYEHTDRLNTLIRSNNNNDSEDNSKNDAATAPGGGIAVLQHSTTDIHNGSQDPEDMEEQEVGLNTLEIGKNKVDGVIEVGRNTKKVVTYSQDLLDIGSKKMPKNTVQTTDTQALGSLGIPASVATAGMDETAAEEDEDNLERIVPRISSSLPVKPAGGTINSGNVAQIVGNMKQFIETTLAEKQDEALKQQHGNNQLLSATGNSITNMFKASSNSTSNSSGSKNENKIITTNSRISKMEEEEGEVVEEAESEEVDEEFLAALKDLADKDIDTLRAIIAAAEQEDDEEEEEDESDSSNADED